MYIARLKRNDGGLVRLRLNSEGIDDELLVLLTRVLPENIYLQHIMLHDNAITGEVVVLESYIYIYCFKTKSLIYIEMYK
jgi:hypothetical protein